MSDRDSRRRDDEEKTELPSKRELQHPIGAYDDGQGTWLSGTGDEEEDPERKEAAKRARTAVDPRRPRE